MHDIPHEIEAYPVAHLPIVKAYADKLDLVGLINDFVPTEMDVDAGTIVLGLVLDTFSGRSPLYRLKSFLRTKTPSYSRQASSRRMLLTTIPWDASSIASTT